MAIEKIELTEWVQIGIMLVRRDCLPTNHQESTYIQIKNMGYEPESFGVFRNLESEKSHW